MRSMVLIFLCALLCITTSNVASADLVYRNPRVFNVTYSFELVPDPAKIDRAKDLKLWIPIPREWDTQKAVQIVSVNPPQHAEYEDPEHRIPMLFWDFGKEPEQTSYKVEIKFRLETYEVYPEVDPQLVGSYDKSSDEYLFYTRSSHTIFITPKVEELAKEAVGDEENPYLQAKRIVEFAHRKVRYKILESKRGRGTKCLLDNPVKDEGTGEEYYEGACSQVGALIIACCRAVGIPARSVHGFIGWGAGEEEADTRSTKSSGLAWVWYSGHMGPHTWTEFYIPKYGWVPVDRLIAGPTDGQEIHPLDNRRWIISKGRDIKIGPFDPQDDNHGYGGRVVLLNDGQVDMFQPGVWNITRCGNAKVRVTIVPDPFPADAFSNYAATIYPDITGAEERLLNSRMAILDWVNYVIRVHPDRETALAEAYSPSGWWPQVRYEKDAYFVCYMLRKILGDERFSQIFRKYGNLRVSSGEPVSTARFQKIAEDIYGKPLGWFFDQWLQAKALPEFRLDRVVANKDSEGWRIQGHLIQAGNAFFRVPVKLAVETEGGIEQQEIWQEKWDSEFEFRTLSKPKKLKVDPGSEILKVQKMPPRLRWFWYTTIFGPSTVIVYGTMAEANENKAAAERFNNEYLKYLEAGNKIIKADVDVIEDDLKADVVFLFGRPATNKISQGLKDIFPIKFEGDKFFWRGISYDQPTQGVAQAIDQLSDPKRIFILYAGLSGEATLQICDSYLYDASASYVIYDRDKQLVSGDWEDFDGDLVWKFESDGE